MLAVVSPGVRSTNENIIINEMDDDDISFGIGIGVGDVDVDDIDFVDFGGANLLEVIDFEDLFVGISTSSDDNHENHRDVLPDLEMDSEILAEFSSSLSATTTSGSGGGGGEEELDHHHQESHEISSSDHDDDDQLLLQQEQHQHINPNNNINNNSSSNSSVVVSDDDVAVSSKSVATSNSSSSKDVEKGRKSSSSGNTQSKNNNPPGKRKVKVDWTPELHRRFVQAVEQLGVDKAVPSRILELMGIDCLTRHNIASHLQKYRSHRKHLLAREAEAANWSQRRQLYGGVENIPVAGGGRGSSGKRDMNPWIAAAPPTMGFPPHMPPPPIVPMPHFRPLHVWGHPSVDQSLVHLWPKHSPPPAVPSVSAAAVAWPPVAPQHVDPSFWHSHQRLTNPLTPGPPSFLPPSPRFPTPPVPGIPSPPTIYKVDPGIVIPPPPTTAGQPLPQPPAADFHPSTESIDAAIGDALSKPWQPLPLGLKPPSVDSVLVELQRQGVPKVPPLCVSN